MVVLGWYSFSWHHVCVSDNTTTYLPYMEPLSTGQVYNEYRNNFMYLGLGWFFLSTAIGGRVIAKVMKKTKRTHWALFQPPIKITFVMNGTFSSLCCNLNFHSKLCNQSAKCNDIALKRYLLQKLIIDQLLLSENDFLHRKFSFTLYDQWVKDCIFQWFYYAEFNAIL